MVWEEGELDWDVLFEVTRGISLLALFFCEMGLGFGVFFLVVYGFLKHGVFILFRFYPRPLSMKGYFTSRAKNEIRHGNVNMCVFLMRLTLQLGSL